MHWENKEMRILEIQESVTKEEAKFNKLKTRTWHCGTEKDPDKLLVALSTIRTHVDRKIVRVLHDKQLFI